MKSKILLVLDLDETLIYATKKQLDYPPDFETSLYQIYKRPGLDKFLKYVAAQFEFGFWSSASNHYVKTVVKHLVNGTNIQPRFVWGRSRCSFEIDKTHQDKTKESNYNYIKKLSKLAKYSNIPLNQILIIDDSPHKSKYNRQNAIIIKEWAGNRNDTELEILKAFLITIQNCPTIDKIPIN